MTTWYAVYDKNTGDLYSTGTIIDISKLPAHLKMKELTKAVDFDVQRWDRDLKKMEDV